MDFNPLEFDRMRKEYERQSEEKKRENLLIMSKRLYRESKSQQTEPDEPEEQEAQETPLKEYQNYMKDRKESHPEETYKQRLNKYRVSKGKKVEDIDDDYSLQKSLKKGNTIVNVYCGAKSMSGQPIPSTRPIENTSYVVAQSRAPPLAPPAVVVAG